MRVKNVIFIFLLLFHGEWLNGSPEKEGRVMDLFKALKQLSVIEFSITGVPCYGGFTGSVSPEMSGSAPNAYLWEDDQNQSLSRSGLAAGPLNAVITSTNVTCSGADDGTITIRDPSGGSGTYEYSINNGTSWQPGGIFTDLPAATYLVKMRDILCTTCEFAPDTVELITSNPLPVLTGTLIAPSICSNTIFDYSPESSTAGTTFSWTRPAILGILPATATGNGNPEETLINLTGSPIAVTYQFTLSANGCINNQEVAVTVLPAPVLSSSLTPPAVCSNSPFNYSPSSLLPGVTFGWSRALVPGISNPPASGTGNISETLINTTSDDVLVNYVYTLSAGGCSHTQTVRATVKPTPLLTESISPAAVCSNSEFVYNPVSATQGTTYTWIRPAVAGISNPPLTGTNGIKEILVNTTALPIDVTYVYTLRANGCQHSQNVTVTVKPSPVLVSTLSPPAICSNSLFSYSPLSLTPETRFEWRRDAVDGIANLPASGMDDPQELLVNTTALPVRVTYVYALTANGCTNTQEVAVTVNPSPSVTVSPTPEKICMGSSTTLTASGAMLYNWQPATGVTATTGATVTARPNVTTTYTVTGTNSQGCTDSATVQIEILPKPEITVTPSTATICKGGSTTLSAAGAATYSWSPGTGLSATTGSIVTAAPVETTTYTVTGADSNGCVNTTMVTITVNTPPVISVNPASTTLCQGSSEILTASGADTYLWNPADGLSSTTGPVVIASPSITTTYTVTGTYVNGCAGTKEVTITVNPVPVLTSTNAPTICSNLIFSYIPASQIPGTTFSWTRAAVPGISNPASSGTGNIQETLINTTENPIGVTYVYTLTANGCTNPVRFNVVISVVPAPTVTINALSTSVCAGSSVTLSSGSGLVSLPATLLSEDFESSAAGWTTSDASTGGTPGAAAWTLRPDGYNVNTTYHSNDNSQFYLSDSRSQGTGTTLTSTVLQSPSINTVGYTTLSLSFRHFYKFASVNNEAARVEVSPDGSNWTTMATYVSDQGGPAAFVQSAISLSAYIGYTKLYIRFYYNCGGRGRYWAIDNVAVTGTSASNPQISWSSVPAGFSFTGENPGAVTPAVTTTYIVTYTDPAADPGMLCPGSNQVTVTVNPKPVMTSTGSATICNGGTVNIPLTASIPSSFTWVAAPNANVTGESTSGQTSGVLSNTLTNTTSTIQTVVYTVTPLSTAGNCPGAPQTVNVIVNPTPAVNQPASQTLCGNGSTTSVTFSGSPVTGTTYLWTNDQPGIGLAANGTGNIPSFTAVNNGIAPIIASVVVTPVANGCPGPAKTFTLTVNPHPAPVIAPDYCSAQPKIKLSATGGTSYLWSTGETTPFILVDLVGIYTVTATNGYGCKETVSNNISNELVVNGDFSMGNTGFTTPASGTNKYTYVANGPGNSELYPEGLYGVGTNGNNYHSNFWGVDHTSGTGNFMIVNGFPGSPQPVVWEQTHAVQPNTDYYFSAYAMSLNNAGNYAELQFNINGTQIGTIARLTAGTGSISNPWKPQDRFYGMWNSGSATSATIQIIDLQTALAGNDFGLDDISFGTLSPLPGTIDPVISGTLCAGSTITLNANLAGGKSPFRFSWIGPNGFTSDLQNPVISNITEANSGTYQLTFSDGYGCAPLVATTELVVNNPSACTISGPSSVCPGSAGNIFNAPSGMAAYQWKVITGSATISGATDGEGVNITAGPDCAASFTLELLITNSAGCTSRCTQVITVEDITTPTWITPAGSLDRTLQCSDLTGLTLAQSLAPTVSDNCSATLTPVKNMGVFTAGTTCLQAGTYTNTWTVTDACNNEVATPFTQLITIVDDTKPEWTTLAGALDRTVSCDDEAGINAAQSLAPGVSDNCEATLIIPVKTAGTFVPGGTCQQAGTITNTWSVMDACGNVGSVYSQVITITDTTAPVVTTATGALDASFECSNLSGIENALAMIPASTDNCDPGPSIHLISDVSTPDETCANAYKRIRTWNFTDDCGNTSVSYTQTISVEDTSSPAWITVTGELDTYIGCNDSIALAAAQALVPIAADNCNAVLTPVKNTGVFLPSGTCQEGTITNTFTVADDCGNISAVFTQLIHLEDNTQPDILAPPLSVITCTDNTTDISETGTATATDNCDTSPVITFTDQVFPTGCAGNYMITRTWTATDACGNSNSADQDIYIQDILSPEIICPPGITIDYSDSVLPAATGQATATDNCDPNPLVSYTDRIIPGINEHQFTIIRTWKAADCSGNTSTCSQFIVVTELTPLTIDCPQDLMVNSDTNQCGATLNPGVLVYTGDDAKLTWEMTGASLAAGTDSIGSFTFNAGVTTITWVVSNGSETKSCIQTITVTDRQPPLFMVPDTMIACVGNVNTVVFDIVSKEVNEERPEYFTLAAGSTALDIDPLTFSDNCLLSCVVEIRWKIDMQDGTRIPTPPASYQTGQPSAYGRDLRFAGDGVNFTSVNHTITYWIVDCAGNISDPISRTIIIKPRPDIVKIN